MAIKCLCSGLLLTAIVLMGDANLLTNPGFESGTTGWADRSCTIEAVTTPVHGGSGSAKVSGRSETWQGIRQSVLDKMSDGKTYKISAWVRLDNSDSDTITISVEQTDDGGTRYINVDSAAASNTEWVQISGEFTLSKSGTLTTLDVYLEGPEPGIDFLVDDVSVVDSSAPAPEPVPAPTPAPAEPNDPNKA